MTAAADSVGRSTSGVALETRTQFGARASARRDASGAAITVSPERLTRLQARDAAAQARAEFAATLQALEDKLNVPKQVGIRVTRARSSFRSFADREPVGALAAVVGIAVAAGGGGLVFVGAVMRNLVRAHARSRQAGCDGRGCLVHRASGNERLGPTQRPAG